MAVLHFIDLEVGRHAEVLEDSVVFDWQSDFHLRNSLNFILRGRLSNGLASASSGACAAVCFLTNPIVAAFDYKRLAVDDRIGNLEAGLFVNLGCCRAGNLHLLRALIVSALFEVNDANRFIFFDKQDNRSKLFAPLRSKEAHQRFTTHTTTTTGSGHTSKLQYRFRQMSESSIARNFQKSPCLAFSYRFAKPLERRNSKTNGRRSRASTPPMPLVQESLRGERLRVAKYVSVTASYLCSSAASGSM